MSIQIKTEIPGPKSRALMAERQIHISKSPFHVTPVFAARASGAVVEDVDGNHLIDFAAGIGVVNLGHAHPALVEAIRKQAGDLLHSSFNVLPSEGYIRLAERLNALTPGTFAKKTFLANSGAEAVENAIKLARAYTGRQSIVCFEHGYHGRTYMAMALTAKSKPYKLGFGPFPSEIYRVPFPDLYRWGGGGQAKSKVVDESFRAFEQLVNQQIGASQVAAVIIEPVLGEGGFLPAPTEYLEKLRNFCTQNGIVLIADEIQTGFGRTGALFASQQLGLVPDLITMAKGLGGGLPISAVTGRAEIMDAPGDGGIGGTYCGNPVACAAALAVLDEFERSDVLNRARAMGEYLQSRFSEWKKKYPIIGDARGLGPMQALEFVRNRETQEPYPEAAKGLVKSCYERGLVIMTAGSYGNVVRLLIPLVIEQKQLDEGLAVLESGIEELAK